MKLVTQFHCCYSAIIFIFCFKNIRTLSDSGYFPYSSESFLKSKFAAEISDTLLKFQGFRIAFTPAYLDATKAAAYAKALAKASSFSPLFETSDDVEEILIEDILQLLLSSKHCNDVKFVAEGIGNILADFTINRGYLTTNVPERVLQTYAGGLAGNMIWRLTRLPRNKTLVPYRKDSSTEIMHVYARFTQSLSSRIQNSTLVTNLCHGHGIDAPISVVLSSAVCGSSFLDFNLGLIKNISSQMVDSYNAVKQIISPNFNSDIHMLIVSAVVGETLGSFILNEGLLTLDNVDEASYDVSKLVNLGIISNELRGGISNENLKDSKFPDNEAITQMSNKERREVVESMSDILADSVIFNNLFGETDISDSKLNSYCESIARGSLSALEQISTRKVRKIAGSLRESVNLITTTDKSESRDSNVKHFARAISKTLFKVFTKRNYFDEDQNFDDILNHFRQIALNVILSLGNEFDFSMQSSEGFMEA